VQARQEAQHTQRIGEMLCGQIE